MPCIRDQPHRFGRVFISVTYRLVKDSGKYKKEDDIQKVDSGNRDVECVGLLVHPRPEDTDTDEENRFNDD